MHAERHVRVPKGGVDMANIVIGAVLLGFYVSGFLLWKLARITAKEIGE